MFKGVKRAFNQVRKSDLAPSPWTRIFTGIWYPEVSLGIGERYQDTTYLVSRFYIFNSIHFRRVTQTFFRWVLLSVWCCCCYVFVCCIVVFIVSCCSCCNNKETNLTTTPLFKLLVHKGHRSESCNAEVSSKGWPSCEGAASPQVGHKVPTGLPSLTHV